jgi:hypothetical protein
MKNFGIRSEKALDYLIGDVKVVTIKTFDIINGVEEFKDHSMSEYNSGGLKSLSLYYKNNGILNLRQVSRFDDDGIKVGYINYNKNDLQDGYGKYDLDYEGRIVSRFYNGQHEETYLYDDDSNIIEVYYPLSRGRDLYEYNEHSLATHQFSLSGENTTFGSLFGGPKKKLTTFLNDHWGNIIEMKVYNAETRDLLFTQNSTINSEGDEIESIGYNGEGSVHAHVKYEYNYDGKGNWISKLTLTNDGLVYRYRARTITYYNENTERFPHHIEALPIDIWRSKRLNGRELALFTTAFIKNFFPKPMKGQLLVDDSLRDGTCTLYFENSYFTELTSSIRNAKQLGVFVRSNAPEDWTELMQAIEAAKPDIYFDNFTLRAHFMSID